MLIDKTLELIEKVLDGHGTTPAQPLDILLGERNPHPRQHLACIAHDLPLRVFQLLTLALNELPGG